MRRSALGALLGEAQQVLGDLLAALGALLDLAQHVEILIAIAAAHQHELHVAEDAGQGVVELVGHAGAQLAHRGQLLRLEQLRLGFFQLGRRLGDPLAQLVVPALQLRPGDLQLGAHVVERGGQRGDLIVPVHLDAPVELAAAEGLHPAHHRREPLVDAAGVERAQGQQHRQRRANGHQHRAGAWSAPAPSRPPRPPTPPRRSPGWATPAPRSPADPARRCGSCAPSPLPRAARAGKTLSSSFFMRREGSELARMSPPLSTRSMRARLPRALWSSSFSRSWKTTSASTKGAPSPLSLLMATATAACLLSEWG